MDLDWSNTFFISDEHFDWFTIAAQGEKAYRLPDLQMISKIVRRMDSYLDEDSVIWHLGDFCEDEKILKYLIRPLPGTHYLLLGNHDTLPIETYLNAGFADVWNCDIILNSQFYLSHMRTEFFQTQKYNLHGHSHGKGGKNYFSLPIHEHAELHRHCYDVSACITDYALTSLDKIMRTFLRTDRLIK
jgi:calcineurin-like phosphoesterase family protein